MKLFYLATASAFVCATPALAADLITPTPKMSEPKPTPTVEKSLDWSGFYAGLNGGYGKGQFETDNATFGDPDIEGAIFGGQVGYNADLGGFVLGVEGDIQWSGVDAEDVGNTDTQATLGMDWFGTVRGRAGADMGKFMPYVTGGLAYGRGAIDGESGSITFDDTQTHVGWAAGAGGEFAVTEKVSVKAEYLYTDFSEETYDLGTLGSGSMNAESDIHTLRAGVNVHF